MLGNKDIPVCVCCAVLQPHLKQPHPLRRNHQLQPGGAGPDVCGHGVQHSRTDAALRYRQVRLFL